jgi:mono/diheme cytochrome c family protein
MPPRLPIALIASVLVLAASSYRAGGAEPPSGFENIRPVLQARCVKCHGDKMLKADLDLRTAAGVLKGGESGAVVIPGQPEKSLLYEKVHDGSMPPGKTDKLSAAEIASIKTWIAGGAKGTGSVEPAITQHDVIPIMLRRCTVCHGRTVKEANLDLRTRASMLKGGKSGPAIEPGKPDESLILKKVRAGKMPPLERLVEASIKVIEAGEVETLAKWIAAGAPEVAIEPDVATAAGDPLVSDKDREFWAFRSPRPVAIPAVKETALVRNPIDAFILQKLELKGLSLSPEADRLTLLRRVSYDLTGLPPSAGEAQAFLKDASPDAYEKAVERLLASPRYGERWGRHWLDLAGYSDSEGKREQDLPRNHAWRYRDYVIKAFNTDKSYDRFLMEQLAGDELADYRNAPAITPEIYDNLVATGFLRMAPDATWANITGFFSDRVEVIADEMDVLGSAVLGLTMKCARCHTHKFDPIPHRDYYRLLAVFKGALDEYDWLKPDIRPGIGPVSQDTIQPRFLPFVTSVEQAANDAHNELLQSEIAALRATVDKAANELAAKIRDERLSKLPAELRTDILAMLATPADKRDAVQRYLAGKFEARLKIDRESLKSLDPGFKKQSDAADARINQLNGQRLDAPKIQAVWDRGEPTPTYIYRRGDPTLPGKLVGPGVPSVLTDGHTPLDVKPPYPGTTGRRLAFAKWVTKPDQPLTARVMVNRIWKHHFGTGIVASLGNFGRTGTPPTHPELLDWLAREFVQRGWSIKAMHRLMVTSATYRQSSIVDPAREKLDPANALLSRMPLTRLDAESLYDSLLQASGKLDESRGGPADPVQVRADGLITPKSSAAGWRRLVYVQQRRKQIPTHLENFDFPQMNPNCVERRDSTVAPQALHLLNNGMVDRLATSFGERVWDEAGGDITKQIDRVYWTAMSRPPTEEERRIGEAALARLAGEWIGLFGEKAVGETAKRQALNTYCHAILNSAAFLYVD